MAQLVARDFWEVEAAGSSPVTQTIFISLGLAQPGSARHSGCRGQEFKSPIPDHFYPGVGAAVARTSGGREVASSILVPPTKQEVERK